MSHFPFKKDAASRLLESPDTRATVLHAIVLSAFGSEALYGNPETGEEAWDPVLVWRKLEDEFKISFPEENENKLNALVIAVSTSAFYLDPQAFSSICQALGEGDIADAISGVLTNVTIGEVIWSIWEVHINRDDNEGFSESVLALMGQVVTSEADDPDGESVSASFEDYCNLKCAELKDQLRELGVAEGHLASIDDPLTYYYGKINNEDTPVV